ncbi:MAG TPA: threonine synthase [Chitinophagaceae bacterium]|jgi:threonine synthase|nr:threonine synthase [Chitinophagaceae bacterium]
MKYFSTNKNSPLVDFKEATIKGQAPDKGLYFPETIPGFAPEMIERIEKLSDGEIAFRVIRPYVGNTIGEEKLFSIVSETINFPLPLVKLDEDIFSLELFHGPTLAFKDVGARFMSRCLEYFVTGQGAASDLTARDAISGPSRKVTVLVATSGDTGGAVADGFYGVEGVNVVILYPSGKVSPVQEKQLTTHGKNIQALEIQGNFDDCQQMVKQAFTDPDINRKLFLTSANSINVARWLPQQFFYFLAYKQWADKNHPPVIAVPSGNFGNIAAGLLAMRSGLPVSHFIAACNVNDIASDFLETGIVRPKQAVPTLSNAMDVGDPSNFIRVLELFGHDLTAIKNNLSAFTVTDKDTSNTIRELFNKYDYLADPHGAVGFKALQEYLFKTGQKGIFLETAHPVKFPDAVEKATGQKIDLPGSLEPVMRKEKHSIFMQPVFAELKEYLLNRY